MTGEQGKWYSIILTSIAHKVGNTILSFIGIHNNVGSKPRQLLFPQEGKLPAR